MQHIEQWIGLPQALYPKSEHNIYSGFFHNDQCPYIVAKFQKQYVFPFKIVRAVIISKV